MFHLIDWRITAFVSASLIQEYWANVHFPKVYYWEMQKQNEVENKKAA